MHTGDLSELGSSRQAVKRHKVAYIVTIRATGVWVVDISEPLRLGGNITQRVKRFGGEYGWYGGFGGGQLIHGRCLLFMIKNIITNKTTKDNISINVVDV
jgi:hypothetical protein